MAKIITEEEYHEHCDSDDGFCTECNEFTRFGLTEPDAREYPCEQCGTNSVLGTEEALMEGAIEIG